MGFLAKHNITNPPTEGIPPMILLVHDSVEGSEAYSGNDAKEIIVSAANHTIASLIESLSLGDLNDSFGKPLQWIVAVAWSGLDGRTKTLDFTGYNGIDVARWNHSKELNPESYKWVAVNGHYVRQSFPCNQAHSCGEGDIFVGGLEAFRKYGDTNCLIDFITREDYESFIPKQLIPKYDNSIIKPQPINRKKRK